MEEETGLLKKIAEGQKELFGELVLSHQDFVFNAVKGMVRFDEEARDITQEVFVRAYENIEKFRGDSKISSWLYRIAYNLSVNWSVRVRGRETQLDDAEAGNIPEPLSAADEAYDRELALAGIKGVMQRLPVKYSVILRLYYFEDKSYREIADVLRIPVNTVKTQLFRARELMKSEYMNGA